MFIVIFGVWFLVISWSRIREEEDKIDNKFRKEEVRDEVI